jgi:TonB family protein
VAVPGHSGDDRPKRAGYLLAVAVSAIAHIGIVIFVLFVLPKLFEAETQTPPSYSVKIVDSIPAGDLGTRLPSINGAPLQPEHVTKPEPAPPLPAKAQPLAPPPADKDAIALNTLKSSPTPTPPLPPPTSAPTAIETPQPAPSITPNSLRTLSPKPEVTPRPRQKETPRPPPRPRPKATPKPRLRSTPIALARTEPTPNITAAFEKLKHDLMQQHLKMLKEEAAKAAEESARNARPSEESDSGPVVADRERAGTGMGIGAGHGSAGMLQDPGFVMYYQDVQDRIKKAWSYAGGNPDLTATVTFGINPDGSLNSLKVTQSSRDLAFDDSVARAIRAAAPFGPPPEKYRDAFARGVPAIFKLSELQAGSASGD